VDEWTRAAPDAGGPAAVRVAVVTEVGRQADTPLRDAGPGEWPVPGSIEWPAGEGTAPPVRRERPGSCASASVRASTRCPP
jgi:hypothetical protein